METRTLKNNADNITSLRKYDFDGFDATFVNDFDQYRQECYDEILSMPKEKKYKIYGHGKNDKSERRICNFMRRKKSRQRQNQSIRYEKRKRYSFLFEYQMFIYKKTSKRIRVMPVGTQTIRLIKCRKAKDYPYESNLEKIAVLFSDGREVEFEYKDRQYCRPKNRSEKKRLFAIGRQRKRGRKGFRRLYSKSYVCEGVKLWLRRMAVLWEREGTRRLFSIISTIIKPTRSR